MSVLFVSVVMIGIVAFLHFWGVPWLEQQQQLHKNEPSHRWTIGIELSKSLLTVCITVVLTYCILVLWILWTSVEPRRPYQVYIDEAVKNASKWQDWSNDVGWYLGLTGLVISLLSIVGLPFYNRWLLKTKQERHNLRQSLDQLSQLRDRISDQDKGPNATLTLTQLDKEMALLHEDLSKQVVSEAHSFYTVRR